MFAAPSTRRRSLTLGLIFALAFLANVVGLDWGLPYEWNADEKVGLAVDMIARNSADPKYFVNPSLHAYLVTVLVETAYLAYPGRQIQDSLPRVALLTNPDDPGRGIQFLAYRLARLLSAVAAVATVWLVFVLGRHQFGEPTALLAAVLSAVTMGLANLAHFATPEATLFVFVVAALIAADGVAARGAIRDYRLAGILVGLACSTKYTAWLLGVPVVAAHVLGRGLRRSVDASGLRRAAVAALAAVLAFFAATPYALLNRNGFLQDVEYNWVTGAPTHTLVNLERSWVPYLRILGNAMGWPLFAVGLCGVVVAAVRMARGNRGSARTRASWIHLTWILAFWGFLGLSPHRGLRFIMPIVPSLVLLGAAAMAAACERLHRRALRVAAGVAVGLVFVYSAAYTAAADWMFLNDPRYAAGRWLAAQSFPPGVGVDYFTIDPYLPYFDRPGYPVRFVSTIMLRNIVGDHFRADMDRYLHSSRNVIADANFWYDRWFDDPVHYPERVDFYHRLLHGEGGVGGYHAVAWFRLRLPPWLRPSPELLGPEIVIFAKAAALPGDLAGR